MSVASPYALYRATELTWPALPPQAERHEGPPLADGTARVRRRRLDNPRPGWNTVVQGELFQLA
ncbi:MAG: hypothetical protein FJ077_10930 [Cyanobacteria bacterium K_DeepCast_35m_m2_023]|nr:hypothetical protein [Cyanobacteria bacterium K_DeepCast_35m_m2_023]